MATRRCRAALLLGALFAAAGLALLVGGALWGENVHDVLLYLGGLGLLFSLAWVVVWRVGNVEVPPSQLRDDVGLDTGRPRQKRKGLGRLLSSLGRRLSAPASTLALDAQ